MSNRKPIQAYFSAEDYQLIKHFCDNKRKKIAEFLRESALKEAGIVQ
jgi:uncharacterized protein (DUF1778 family)